jgi:hypothetical protein
MPSTAYNLERFKRHPLTKTNLRELGIDLQTILTHPSLVYTDSSTGVQHHPVGVSINKERTENFQPPGTKGCAFDLGWLAYMNLGEPLIEERGDITPPPPDTFSSRAYVNRSDTHEMTFTDSVEFTVSNGVTWSLHGDAKLTFGGSIGAQLQLQLQNQLKMDLQAQFGTQLRNDMANKNANTVTNKNSKDSVGVDNANATETATTNSTGNSTSNSVTDSVAFTTQGSATGNASLNAQLALGLAATVGGSLTTSWTSKSQISGKVPTDSRVETLATQRRAHRHYEYEIPVTFAGYLAVQYAVPVPVLSPPQPGNPALAQVVAYDIASINLAGGGYRMKGRMEIVSALDVHHTMFEAEPLTYSPRALYKI